MKLTTLALLSAVAASAQQPRIVNARLETRAAGNLTSTYQSFLGATDSPAWIAWTVPTIKGRGNSCNDWNGGGNNKVMLEGSTAMVLLFRVEHHAVDKSRSPGAECEIDGGGLPVIYLNGVKPSESVALLETMGKVDLVAMHDDPSADAALERFNSPSQPQKIREKVSFALAAFRGKRGFDMLKRFNANEQDDRIREKNMFAFSVAKDPEAVDILIDSAKNDKSPRVRSQALFWMAHKAGDRQKAAIESAVNNDPEIEVKKKAVFALQQLPDGQGIPLLIDLARNNKTPEVRKQAMFWLGQSKDPRAVTFFAEILGR